MVAALRRVLGTSSNEDLAVVGLDWAETNRDVEVDVEELTRFLVLVDVVVVDGSLIELEIVYPVESVSHSLIFLPKATTSTFKLSHRSLHHMQPWLVEAIVHWVPCLHLTRHPLYIWLEPCWVVSLNRSVGEINLTLAHWFKVMPWPMSILPTLRTFLPPLMRTEIIVLRIRWFVSLLLEEHPVQLDVAIVHH